jgi:DNA-binding NtrC family response regulator
MVKSLLIVDDDPAQRRILEETVKRLGFETKTASSGEQALQILDGPTGANIGLVLLDLVMDGVDGMAVLDKLNGKPGLPPIIVQTAHGSIDAAINAMRAGAVDFVVKPASPERLEVSIKSALKIEALADEISRIKKKVQGTLTFADLIIRGDGMERVIALGKRAAASNIPVLIEGESGVGKELIARAVQGESERAGKPFIVVNCGAIPENLVESVLFGHEKGSFTGAVERKPGKLEIAARGTVLLDEVGDMEPALQGKLLRVLEERTFERVGGVKPIEMGARVISASHRDLGALVEENRFRLDLYHRLSVFPIAIAPLRARGEDVVVLANHFIDDYSTRMQKRIAHLGGEVRSIFLAYDWPGNVRELKNVIERAVILAATDVTPALLPDRMREAPRRSDGAAGSATTIKLGMPESKGGLMLEFRPGTDTLDDLERRLLEEALRMAGGKKAKAAEILGISRFALLRRVEKFGL